jgi:hypothetical protein
VHLSLPSAGCKRRVCHCGSASQAAHGQLALGRVRCCMVTLRATALLIGRRRVLQVYRGLRGGVQDIAVKVLHASDEAQTRAFRKVASGF